MRAFLCICVCIYMWISMWVYLGAYGGCKYISLDVCKYAGMQACRHVACMCKHVYMQVFWHVRSNRKSGVSDRAADNSEVCVDQ